MAGLLLDEHPLVIQPSLVRRFGIAEAAILQQLHYWLLRAKNSHEGYVWAYKTYAEWSDETGMSVKAVRGALKKLRDAEVVVSIDSPVDPHDRTLWWRIDYRKINPEPSPNPPAPPTGHLDVPERADGSAQEGSSRAPVPGSSSTETTNRDYGSLRSQGAPAREVEWVFAEWTQATERSRTQLTPDRRRCIQQAIASHGLDDCLAAVRNIGVDQWARGANDRGKRFDDVKHALGNAERIERYRDAQQPLPAGVTPIRRGEKEARQVAILDEMLHKQREMRGET